MIIYDLTCDKNHTFEAWFHDSAAFEEQKQKKLITCPVCSSDDITMVPPRPKFLGKKNQGKSDDRTSNEINMYQALQKAREYIDSHFEDVGDKFAEVALAIHNNEREAENIKGTTTEAEETVLREEGVQFFKIPVVKYDS